MLPQSVADIMRGIVRANDRAFLAFVIASAGEIAIVILLAVECVSYFENRNIRHSGQSHGKHELFWSQCYGLALALDHNNPFFGGVVIVGALCLCQAPIIKLPNLGVGFDPVAQLILGREDWPIVRELQIGEMVVPDGIMQAQRLVALEPLIAGPLVLLNNDVGHGEPFQPRAEHNTALPTPNNDTIRLLRMTERFLLFLFLLMPILAARHNALHKPKWPVRPLMFDLSLELPHGGQQV